MAVCSQQSLRCQWPTSSSSSSWRTPSFCCRTKRRLACAPSRVAHGVCTCPCYQVIAQPGTPTPAPTPRAHTTQGLARALVALHRAEAQRTAAQQRASAAQLRVVHLEKRLTGSTTEQMDSGERLVEMRERAAGLEAQVRAHAKRMVQRRAGLP